MDMVSSKTVHIWMRLKKITESDTDASASASAPAPAPAPAPCYPALRVPPAVTRLTVYRWPQVPNLSSASCSAGPLATFCSF